MYAIPVFVFEKAIYSGLDLYPVTATIPPAGYCFHSQSFLNHEKGMTKRTKVNEDFCSCACGVFMIFLNFRTWKKDISFSFSELITLSLDLKIVTVF